MESFEVVRDHVSRVVYAEARGEPYVGKLAVAWVIKNRFNHPDQIYGESIGEITREGQFAKWRKPIGDENAWRECIRAAEGVFNGTNTDPTGGATHFYSGDEVPYWAEGKQPVVEIGGHKFFNNID